MIRTTIFSVLIILTVACSSTQENNPYNLNLISTHTHYIESIRTDSSNLLVDLEKHIPNIVLDIRYATDNNFTGTKIYSAPKAYLRKPAADSLKSIQAHLNSIGLGIKVFDAYRPYSATLYFYEVYPDTNFVAAPWKGSIHNRGCAVDLTIIDLENGEELLMPTPFDDFTQMASHNYTQGDSIALQNREKLATIMENHGFDRYDYEWWHYNFSDRQRFGLLNISFESLQKISAK